MLYVDVISLKTKENLKIVLKIVKSTIVKFACSRNPKKSSYLTRETTRSQVLPFSGLVKRTTSTVSSPPVQDRALFGKNSYMQNGLELHS